MRVAILAIVLEMIMVSPAASAIIQVPSVHSTIQAGINAAAPGDTVQVAPGTYTGPSNRNLDFAGKNILLRSSAGAATTIIDCQSLARGMRFHSGETAAAIVQGFTIRNGLASGTLGGGIAIEGTARPTIRQCRFVSNRANTGGGISVASGVTLIDCDFTTNTADNGGGGIYGEAATLELSGCSFDQNQAGFGAGGYVAFGSSVTLLDCTFNQNVPGNLAGGFYGSESQFVVRRCSFEQNEGNEGAGMWLLTGAATIDSCTFTNNTAEWSGGGIRAESVELFRLTNSLFEGNSTLRENSQATYSGGGGLAYRCAVPLSQGPYIADCTFLDNNAFDSNSIGGSGGGMRIIAGPGNELLVERCGFIGNHADLVAGGAYALGRFRNCLFQDNDSESYAGLTGAYEITECTFVDNHALRFGGACDVTGGPAGVCTIQRCEFSGNSSGERGGGLYWINSFGTLTVEDSRFSDNYSSTGGGAYIVRGQAITFTRCTFEGNTAVAGGAMSITGPAAGPPSSISECTFVGNGAQVGGSFNLVIPVEIANTIIAFGTQGEAIFCSGNGIGAMSCTDIFGNAGGNWTGCIADQLGINGNFSLNPQFCNAGGRDYRLAQSSPCTAANAPAGCGLIGVFPIGCANPIGIADAEAPSVTPILRVTPNPVRGAGMIEWSGVGGREAELRLYDVTGRIVAQRVELGIGGELPWTTLVGAGAVPSGVYFLEIGERRDVQARVRLVVVR